MHFFSSRTYLIWTYKTLPQARKIECEIFQKVLKSQGGSRFELRK